MVISEPFLRFPDLSHYEPDVQFHAMKAAGIPLFITKATEGIGFTDPTYTDFQKRGRSVGLIVGAFTLITPDDITRQVSLFLSVAELQSGDLQPVIDMENAGLTRYECASALSEFRAHGYNPIVYCSLDFFNTVLRRGVDAPLWVAAYRSLRPKLPIGQRFFAWQYTDAGDCPGVAKPCDMSRFYGSIHDLKAYTI